MSVKVLEDRILSENTRSLEPHNNVFLLTTPLEVSDNLSLPKPTIASMSSWLEH